MSKHNGPVYIMINKKPIEVFTHQIIIMPGVMWRTPVISLIDQENLVVFVKVLADGIPINGRAKKAM
jgi:hypothetical protein